MKALSTDEARALMGMSTAARQEKPTPAKHARERLKREGSELEVEFAERWSRLFPNIDFQEEHLFHPTRKWRFDFAHIETKTAIEIEGGTWVNGAHSRGKHYESDCLKYNAASALGWTIFRLTTDMSRSSDQLALIAKFIEERMV